MLGNNWTTSNTDLRIAWVSTSQIDLIYNASLKVPLTGSDAAGYASASPNRISLQHDSTAKTYTLENETTGALVTFFDFSSYNAEGKKGRIKSVSSLRWDSVGKNGYAFSYNASGQVEQITTSDGQAYTIEFTYTNDLLTKVEVIDASTDPDTVLQAVEYLHHSDTEGHHSDTGDTGDLLQVKRTWQTSSDTGGTMSNVRYTQYRYDSDGRLAGVYHDETIREMIGSYASISSADELLDQANSYTGGTTVSIEDHADKWVTYASSDLSTSSVDMTHWSGGSATEDLETLTGFSARDESGFVATQRIGSNGCSSCGGGTSYSNKYYYLENSSASDDNEVKYLVVQDMVDNDGDGLTRTIYGLNHTGYPLRQVVISEPYGSAPDRQYHGSSDKLVETNEHQTSGKERKRYLVKELRGADVHDITDDADLKKFLDPYDGSSWANDTATLLGDADGSGAVFVHYYNDEGRELSSRVKRGHDGAEYYLSATDWKTGTESHLVDKTYEFPTKTNDLNDGIATSYTYTYWTGTETLKSYEVTGPTVATTENGSGQAISSKSWYDEAGRQRWTRDGEGYYNYYSYCKETGLPAYEAYDVDPTSLPSGASASHLVQVADEGANTLSLSRGSSLPAEIEQESTTHYDMLGRPVLVIDPSGSRHATIYEDDRTISMPELDGNGVPQGVISYTKENSLGQTTESIAVRADYTAVSTTGTSPNKTPTGFSTEPVQSDYVSWTRYEYDTHGRTKWVDSYHDIPTAGVGTIGDNFTRVATLYDDEGRSRAGVTYVDGTEASATVQVRYSKLDSKDRPSATQGWRETGFSFTSMSFSSVETTAMSKPLLTETKYAADGEVEGYLAYHNATGIVQGDYTYTKSYYDFRGREVGSERYFNSGGTGTPLGPFTVSDLDWMGRVTATAVFDTQPTWSTITGGYGDTDYAEDTTTGRRSLSRTRYDDLGRVYRTEQVMVNGSTGAVVAAIRTDNYHDARGNLVATCDPNGTGMEYAYDGVGRQYQSRHVTELEATKYSSGAYQYRAPTPEPSLASMTGGDDKVLTLSHTVYDADGLSVEQHDFDANQYDNDGLDLDGSDCVRTTSFSWYDDRGRLTTAADYGSGNGSSSANVWAYNTAPAYNAGSEPGWSDSAVRNGYLLLTKFGYDDRTGRQNLTTSGVRDGASAVETTATKTFVDDLSRQTHVVENWQGTYNPTDGGTTAPSSAADEDREVRWEYNGVGQTTKLIAVNGSTDQTTQYLYEDPHNASRVTSTIYPDSADTSSSGTDQVKTAYHLDGSVDTITDQRGVVRTYTYDDHRRVTLDAATTLPAGVDGAARSIGRAYDDLGRVTTITSYDTATSPGPSNIVNQVKHTYDDAIGRITKTEQEYDGAVTAGTPAVSYDYDESISSDLYSNGLRRTVEYYPTLSTASKRENAYGSAGSTTDRLNRLTSYRLYDGSLRTGTHSHKLIPSYTGGGRMTRLRSDAGSIGFNTQINYYDITTDTFSGWDRFGRVAIQEWERWDTGWTVVDKHTYSYDLAGNRTERLVPGQTAHDQTFTYDGLQRLQSVDSGTTGADRYWDLDALGNWDELFHNTTGTGTPAEDRSHNAANELTGIGTQTFAHDAAGNLTADGPSASDDQFVYDAWNRLVRVFYENQAEVEVDRGLYAYDGLNRRIERTESSTTTRFYYNDKWQVLTETDASDNATAIYLYNDDYVDSVAVRMTSTGHSDGEGEHLYLHDALYNVTALLDDSSGNPVAERYAYSPYGEATYLDASYNALTTQASAVDNELLYTGRRVDPESGLQLNRNRYYHQQLGRWVTRDPLGYVDGYSLYSRYDAVNATDPYGERIIVIPRRCPQRIKAKCRRICGNTTSKPICARIRIYIGGQWFEISSFSCNCGQSKRCPQLQAAKIAACKLATAARGCGAPPYNGLTGAECHRRELLWAGCAAARAAYQLACFKKSDPEWPGHQKQTDQARAAAKNCGACAKCKP